MATWVPLLNFVIFLAILVWATRKPTLTFVKTRHEDLTKQVFEVRQRFVSAEKDLQEYSAKLQSINVELKSMKDRFVLEANELKSRTLSDAKNSAGAIVESAKTTVGSLAEQVRTEIRQELVNRILEKADGKLKAKLTADDKTRIRREFSAQLGGST